MRYVEERDELLSNKDVEFRKPMRDSSVDSQKCFRFIFVTQIHTVLKFLVNAIVLVEVAASSRVVCGKIDAISVRHPHNHQKKKNRKLPICMDHNNPRGRIR
jgi:hypothetical protein